MFTVQKLLSECQSHRDCQMPVNHLLFGRDPCPGTTKYLHVDYKCKPSEFSTALKTLTSSPAFPNPYFPSVITTVSSLPFDALSPHSAEHKRHVVCEGETMVLRCKPPRVLNIYAAVYGRGLAEPDICPSHLTRPPPFGESTTVSLPLHGGN